MHLLDPHLNLVSVLWCGKFKKCLFLLVGRGVLHVTFGNFWHQSFNPVETNIYLVCSPSSGNYYSLSGQHEKAAIYFQRALKLNPQYTSAWTLMGHEYMEMKNTSAAIQCYRRAIGEYPCPTCLTYFEGFGKTDEHCLPFTLCSIHRIHKNGRWAENLALSTRAILGLTEYLFTSKEEPGISFLQR